MDIKQIRQQYPQYEDLSDEELAKGLHQKFYPDMDFSSFKQQIGLTQPTIAEQLTRQVGLTARGGISGVTSPLQVVGDALNTAVNYGLEAAGIDYRFPSVSGSTQNLMTQAGLPQPSTSTERAVQAGVEAMTSVVPGVGMAKAAPQTLGALGEKLGTQVASSAVAAPMAQQAAEKTTQATENPLAGLAAGLAAGVVGGGTTAKAIKFGQKTPSPITIGDVQEKARQAYQDVKNSGISVKPLSANKMIMQAEKDLEKYSFNPIMPEHKPVALMLNSFKQMVGTQRVSFDKLEQMRQLANQLKQSRDAVTRTLGGRVVQSIDEYMSSLQPQDLITGKGNLAEGMRSLQTARNSWKVAARAQMLEDVLDVAAAKAIDPKASENELIRRGLINLIKNKQQFNRLFTPQEREAIKKAAGGGTKDVLLSLIARFNPARSQITAAGTVAGGMAYDPLLAGTTAAVGFGADKMQQAYRQKAVQDAMQGLLTGQFKPDDKINMYRILESSRQGIE